MESSEMQEKVINLGNQLVALLGGVGRTDMLSRWIAHYLAELMARIEAAEGTEKVVAEERCFRSILELWSHRRSFPDGVRPFEDLEPILETLTRLNPDEPVPFFHRLRRDSIGPEEVPEVLKLVNFIDSLDVAARTLIESVLTDATAKATRPETKALLESAIPVAMAIDLDAIRRVIQRCDALESPGNPVDEFLRIQKRRLEQMELFSSLCAEYTDNLRSEIQGRL